MTVSVDVVFVVLDEDNVALTIDVSLDIIVIFVSIEELVVAVVVLDKVLF